MTVITWRQAGRIYADRYLFGWLQVLSASHTLTGMKSWGYAYHKKDGKWRYCFINWKFLKLAQSSDAPWKTTRLTLHFGGIVITFGGIDMERNYRDVYVVAIRKGNKLSILNQKGIIPRYTGATHDYVCPAPRCGWSGNFSQREIMAHFEEHKRAYANLDKAYPQDTWKQ